MKVGEFSQASGIGVRLLRHYHQEGLLVPAEVDPSTGYRRYDPRQVDTARLLVALQRAGLPLREAAALAADPSPDRLAEHLAALEESVEVLRRAVSGDPRPQAAEVRLVSYPAARVVVRDAEVSVHEVAETVRRARISLRDAAPRATVGAFHVRLLDAAWTSATVTLRLLVTWPRGEAPAGWRVEQLAPRSLRVLPVGALLTCTLADVMAAHRALEHAVGGDAGAGGVWQLYDGAVERLWVARG